jgi:hypothetical protein
MGRRWWWVAAGFGVKHDGVATRGRRRRDGLTSGGAERDRVVRCARTVETTSLKHARSGGALAARRRRGFGQWRLQTGDDLV